MSSLLGVRATAAQGRSDSLTLDAVVDSLLTAYTDADPDGVAAFYAPNGAILTHEGLLTGDAIAAALSYHFARITHQTFAFAMRDTRFLSDRHAVTSAIGTTAGADVRGAVIFEGRIVVSIHWHRIDGSWRIVFTQEDLR